MSFLKSKVSRKYLDCDGWKEGRWIYQLWKFRDEAIQVGEIIALYVLKDYYGKGVSEQLMHAAFDVLNHFSEIYLWVLKDNKRAVAFYQKMGFSFDGQEKILKLGKPVKELRMVCSSNKNS